MLPVGLRRAVPTKRFWWLVLAGVPLALLGAFAPGLERVLWLYNAGLFLALWLSQRGIRPSDLIRVARSVEPILSIRAVNPVDLTLESLADSTLTVEVRDEAPETSTVQGNQFSLSLRPGEEIRRRYTVVPTERGAERFAGTYLRVLAPLGLACVEERLDNGEDAHVYPNVKAVRDFDLLRQRGHLHSTGLRKSRVRGLGTEFESLRDYNDDDIRFVDWPATARRGKLVVKNFEQERNQAVFVCVDVGRHMLGEVGGVTKIDLCLDASLMLMHAAEQGGDQVGLMAFDDSVRRYVPPKRGRAHVAALLQAVHDVPAQPIQPNYSAAFSYLASRWKRRAMVVVFTDAENEDQGQELAAALASLRKHHLVFVVRVSDPRLRELREKPVTDAQSLAERAAAVWYGGDRRRAEWALRRGRLHSLEAEPQDLAAALVAAYDDAKRLALI